MDLQTVDNPKQVVFIGPTNKNLFKYVATSASATNIIFNNIVAPSLSNVMKRCLRIAMSVNITTTFTAATGGAQMNALDSVTGAPVAIVAGTDGGAPNPTATVCLRACPLASVCSSIDVRLNGGSTSCALNQYNLIHPYISGDDNVRRYSSEMPLQHDNSAVYEATSANSPFLNLNGNSNVPARGSFIATQTGATAAGGTSYNVQWVEELFIDPFLTGMHMADVGLANVNNLTISIRLDPLVNMLSAVNVAGCTYAVALDTAFPPALLVEFLSQNSILGARTPQTCVYDYNQIQSYTRSVGTLSGAAGVLKPANPIAGDALRLPCLPSKIYLYVCPTVKGPRVPDSFVRITNVSINFNDKTNLLASMDESDLYTMSANNAGGKNSGYMTFNQYRYGVGSIIIIDVEKDLSINESAQAGSQNQFSTLQATVTLDNSNLKYAGAAAVDYTLYQVVVSPGHLYLSPSQGEFVINGPAPSTVLALTADGSAKVDEQDLPDSAANVHGKGFSDLLSKGLKLAMNHIRPEHVVAGFNALKKHVGGGSMHPRAYHGAGISLG